MATATDPNDWSQYYETAPPPQTSAPTAPASSEDDQARTWLENYAKQTWQNAPTAPNYDKALQLFHDARSKGLDYQAALSDVIKYGSDDPNFWGWTVAPTTANGDLSSAPHYAGYTGAGGSSTGTLGDLAIDPSYLSPFTTPAPTFRQAPAFAPPTADSIYADPSFQFRLKTGEQALENSASARGTLNTGGTLGDVMKLGSEFASQEYPMIYNRALDAYKTNVQTQNIDPFNFANMNWQNARDTYYANQSNPWGKLYQAANLGVNAANA